MGTTLVLVGPSIATSTILICKFVVVTLTFKFEASLKLMRHPVLNTSQMNLNVSQTDRKRNLPDAPERIPNASETHIPDMHNMIGSERFNRPEKGNGYKHTQNLAVSFGKTLSMTSIGVLVQPGPRGLVSQFTFT